MTPEEQVGFVQELCALAQEQFYALAEKNKVPPEFDGHELRVWLSDWFKDAARHSELRRHPHGRRNSDYRNWAMKTPT